MRVKAIYWTTSLFFLTLLALMLGTGSAADRAIYIEVPLGLPEVVAPKDNPPTLAKVELGKMLYFDPRLSLSGDLSCASCHNPTLGYSNAGPVAVGHQHALGGRNAPTVLNATFASTQFWDGRAPSLEAQAAGPMTAGVEMAGIPEEIVQKLAQIPEYRELCMAAFGEYLSFDNIRKAIATFERTILAGNSPFDKYYYGNDKGAITGAALRGKAIYDDPNKGNCKKCHSYTKTDGYFSDNQFHNVGIGYDKKLKKGENYDLGRFDVTNSKEDKGRFRTPTLRNITQTAPYFHDGRTYSLSEAALPS